MTQIVGIVLIRNEDLNIEWALRNILDFCDRIIVLDNYSTDHTYDKVAALAAVHSKIELRRYWNAKKSQKALRGFYQTDTWLFPADGDEIYDPIGLDILRKRILSGEFDSVYHINGDSLHCTGVDFDNRTATGWLSQHPDVKNVAGMLNFRLVRGWENENRQRLHGHPIFNDKIERRTVSVGGEWDTSPLRCLHLCFMPRSSGVVKYPFSWIGWKRRRKERTKPNPSGNPHNARHGPGDTVEYKMRHYARGEMVERDIGNFLKMG